MIMTESIAALIFPILFMMVLLHIVKGLLGKQRIESGSGIPERQDTATDNAEMIPDGNQTDDLGFEIPRMRHAPRIERQGVSIRAMFTTKQRLTVPVIFTRTARLARLRKRADLSMRGGAVVQERWRRRNTAEPDQFLRLTKARYKNRGKMFC